MKTLFLSIIISFIIASAVTVYVASFQNKNLDPPQFSPFFVSLDSYGQIWFADFNKNQVSQGYTLLTPSRIRDLNFGQVSSVDISTDDSNVVAGTETGDKGGSLYFFDKQGNLLWSHQLDRNIFGADITPDGSHVIAQGFTLATYEPPRPDQPPVFLHSAIIYYYDKNGDLLWSYDAGNSFLEEKFGFSKDGSIIRVVASDKIFYFDNKGTLLTNYTGGNTFQDTHLPPEVRISDDGQYIAWGRYTDNGDMVLFYKNQGNLLWSYDGQKVIFTDWIPIILIIIGSIAILIAVIEIVILKIWRTQRH
ncbi:MAG: hypothetical protein HY223_10475 [Thaumarchaeota archaeon]|nr:hypothetical protein [Nitrososphaerota archaeon]